MQFNLNEYLSYIEVREEQVIVDFMKRVLDHLSEKEKNRLTIEHLDNILHTAYRVHPKVVARQKATLASSNVRCNS